MELKDTVTQMVNPDYKERFKAEYIQVHIRYHKLLDMAKKIYLKEDIGFKPFCPLRVYISQLKAMRSYLKILYLRALMEHIVLPFDYDKAENFLGKL